MAQTSFAGKRCFLTGAASGIGRATALRLAAQGAELYLTDRNAEGLAETVADARALAAQVPEYRALDVADYHEVASFAADIHTRHPSMDLVMNIAGVSAWGTVDQLSHEQWSRMVAINLMGPIHVIESFVPPMMAAGRGGHLVNVSSAAGLVALPWHAAYSASKYGLRGLSEVLRFDLARHRIGVSVVVPGAVNTPLVNTVDIAGVDRDDPRVKRWVDRFSGHAVSPEKAAEKILAGVAKNLFLIYTSADIRELYAFERVE
ncbi:SDR family oxidoreductase, partial [uncultured Mycobacterium sp.]|uniref:SDR family oxidoreductase n=1 Tax=uncultured Mycobacterium sp. TaxID=171292 RepID=UPI0035CC357F